MEKLLQVAKEHTHTDSFSAREFDTEIAQIIYKCYKEYAIEQNVPLKHYRPHVEPCSSTLCDGERIDVVLFTSSTADNFACTANDKIHPCSEYCTQLDNEELHASELHENYKASQLHSSVYFCNVHCRFHACGQWCTYVERDSMGSSICVLSGNVVDCENKLSFGSGTRVQSSSSKKSQSHVSVARKRLRDTVVENPSKVLTSAEEPRIQLFGDLYNDNTFGDGLGYTLDTMYTQSYSIIFTLIFSRKRENVENEKFSKYNQQALKKVHAYTRTQERLQQPIFMSECRNIYASEMLQHRLYPSIILPPNSIVRLTSMYALTIIEFYLQFKSACQSHASQCTRRTKALIHQFFTYNFEHVIPCILSCMQHGLHYSSCILISEDWIVKAVFPESKTLEQIGYSQKHCTDIDKGMKQCLSGILSLNIQPELLVTTCLDQHFVLRSTDSVVQKFLMLRRARLLTDGIATI